MAAMETLVLIGASVIDGTGAKPARGRAVVVEGGRITRVVDAARAPRGRRIDLSGCTLLPGLINCHVHLGLGADSGTPLNFHGSLLPELELMVKYGMTPLEAIRSATSVAAEALGLGGETGRVAAGYAADLLAVAGQSAERIGALGDVRLVRARGAIFRSP